MLPAEDYDHHRLLEPVTDTWRPPARPAIIPQIVGVLGLGVTAISALLVIFTILG